MSWSEQFGMLLEHLAIFVTSLASLIIALKANNHARQAKEEITNHRNGEHANMNGPEDECST